MYFHRIVRCSLFFLLIGFTSCKTANVTTANEDFREFYQRFLTDSSFQLQRVQFPLPGEKVSAETQDSTYRWTEDEWIMLQEFELDTTQYKRDLHVTDTLAVDEIYTPGAGFYFKMVFEPVKRKWHLVYLVDQGL